jgi:hypothetical protein
MMAKTAEKKVEPTMKEIIELTFEQKITKLRNLRADHLFVCNLTYLDALFAAYDSEKAATIHLGQATAALLKRAETAEAELANLKKEFEHIQTKLSQRIRIRYTT